MAIKCHVPRFDRCSCTNQEPHGRIWYSDGNSSRVFVTKKEGMIYISRAAFRGNIENADVPRLMNQLLHSDLPDGAIARISRRTDLPVGTHAILCVPNEPWLVFTSKTGGRLAATHALQHGYIGSDDMLIILQEIDGLSLPDMDEDYDRLLTHGLALLPALPPLFDEMPIVFERVSDDSDTVEVRRAPDGSLFN